MEISQKSQRQQQYGDYICEKQLGKGTFGTVLKAIKKSSQLPEDLLQEHKQNQYYAIKIQTINTLKPMLHLQYSILSSLKQKQHQLQTIKRGYQFPQTSHYEQHDFYCFMVMELLDITLEDFSNKQRKNYFSKDCLLRIFYNILMIIQKIHQLGYIHRDIKPANFMLKRNDKWQQDNTSYQKYLPLIYPIDLGLCKKYINPITSKHISFKQNKKMVGTALFCSINTHKGFQQSRRDDIQAIVYMITYLVKKLPWETVCNKVDQKQPSSPKKNSKQISSPMKKIQKNKLQTYDQIYQIKKTIKYENFLNDPGILPNSLFNIYNYVLKLEFEDQPNYNHIYSLLQKEHFQLTNKILQKNNCECKWTDQSVKKSVLKPSQCVVLPQKKIKINFKIPANKLKKPIKESDENEITQNNQKL